MPSSDIFELNFRRSLNKSWWARNIRVGVDLLIKGSNPPGNILGGSQETAFIRPSLDEDEDDGEEGYF